MVIAGAMLVLIMFFVSADVFGRYFFNAPIGIQFELTQNHLLVMATVLAYSWGVREGAHMRVEFILDSSPDWVQRLVIAASSAAIAIIFGVVTYYSAIDVVEAWRNNEMTIGVIDWPVVWSHIWIPLGAGVLTLRQISMIFMAFTTASPGSIYGEAEDVPEV